MTKDELRRICQAEPFRPFTAHLTNGRSYHVPTRDYVSIHPLGSGVLFWCSNESGSYNVIAAVNRVAYDGPEPGDAA